VIIMGLFKRKNENDISENRNAERTGGNKICPKCGTSLEADVKFCPHCGAKAGTFICNKCGASLPADAKFCPMCANDVRTSRLGKLLGSNQEDFSRKREWRRNTGDFASRFEVEDLRGTLKKTVTVAEGTRALLFQGGAYVGDLKPGHYSIGNIPETHLPINLDDRATVVLVDDGIIAIDFSLDRTQVRTADSIQVGISGTLTLRNTDSKKFIDNLLKGKSQILLSDLQADLTYDIQSVIHATLSRYNMDDLYGNLAVKQEIEEQVRTHVAPTLNSYGFLVERLRFVRWDETDWKDIIEKRGTRTEKVAGTELDIDTEQKIQKLLSDGRINTLSTEDSVEAFVHELAKTGIIRTSEIEELKIELYNKQDDTEFIRSVVRDKVRQMHRHETADAELDHTLSQDDRQQEHNIKTDDAKREYEDKWAGRERARDAKETGDLIDIKKQMNETKLQKETGEQGLRHSDLEKETEIEGKKLAQYTNASAEALITIAESDTAKHLTELEKMKRAAPLKADQIVALNAKDPVAAAEAMKEKFGTAEREKLHATRLEDQQKYMEMTQKNFGENSDRLADVMNQALNAMGSTATARSNAHQAQGSTVVAGGGMGQPVIVNPVQPEKTQICTGCKTENSTSADFCTKCGQKL